MEYPEIPELPKDEIEKYYPGGFGIRDEANAVTAYAFRNGIIEDLHAGKESDLVSDPSLSRITDPEMKELMIEASKKVAFLLQMKERDPEKYNGFVTAYGLYYCRGWQR